jgi:hypothetical protein
MAYKVLKKLSIAEAFSIEYADPEPLDTATEMLSHPLPPDPVEVDMSMVRSSHMPIKVGADMETVGSTE